MWRALFVAIGIYLMILGVQCLGVKKFVLKAREVVVQEDVGFVPQEPQMGPKRQLAPPPWAAYSLMSTGAVVCLYSFSIPKRFKS